MNIKSTLLSCFLMLLIATEAIASPFVRGLDLNRRQLRLSEALLASLTDKAGDPCAVMLDYWVLRGFWDCRCMIVDDTLRLSLGMPVKRVSMQLAGASQRGIVDSWPLPSGSFERNLARFQQPFRDSGYYYAQSRVDSMWRNGMSLQVAVRVIPGPRVTVQTLLARGNDGSYRPLPERLERQFRGGYLTDRTAPRLASALALLDSTLRIDSFVVTPRPGLTEADLTVVLPDRGALRIAGALGIGGGANSRAVGSLHLTATDLFGPFRSMQLAIERPDDSREQLRISYQQPLPLFGLGRVTGELGQRAQTDSYSQVGAEAGLHTLLGDDLILSALVSGSRTETKRIDERYQSIGATLKIVRQTTEWNGRGNMQRTSLAVRSSRRSGTTAGRTSPSIDTRLTAGHSQRVSILDGLHLQARLQYDGYTSDRADLPLAEQLLVGGPPFLRGYRNEQFSALRFGSLTIEPTIPFSAGQFFFFLDAATIRPVDATTQKPEIGVGTGLRLIGTTRSLVLELGWARRAALDQARLSVSLSESF